MSDKNLEKMFSVAVDNIYLFAQSEGIVESDIKKICNGCGAVKNNIKCRYCGTN